MAVQSLSHTHHLDAHTAAPAAWVCDRKMPVFIALCSLTPSNPFRVSELYGQFTLVHALYSLCSLKNNPHSGCGTTSDMCGIDSSCTLTWMQHPSMSAHQHTVQAHNTGCKGANVIWSDFSSHASFSFSSSKEETLITTGLIQKPLVILFLWIRVNTIKFQLKKLFNDWCKNLFPLLTNQFIAWCVSQKKEKHPSKPEETYLCIRPTNSQDPKVFRLQFIEMRGCSKCLHLRCRKEWIKHLSLIC